MKCYFESSEGSLGSARESRAVSGDSPETSLLIRRFLKIEDAFGESPNAARESRALPGKK
jgi:hypothetical protein